MIAPVPTLALDNTERLLSISLSGLSANSCRVYRRHLTSFISWLRNNRHQLCRETVTGYLEIHHRFDSGTYNQALSSIKRLATQSAENGWLSWHIARSIDGITGKQMRGTRSGNWLSLDQARALIALPDNSLIGKRDRAALALLLGCGLRRDEAARLAVSQFQYREGRAMLIDIVGKGNRVRSLAVPIWAAQAISAWLDRLSAPSPSNSPILRSFNPQGSINGSLSASGIWDIVQHYAALLGVTCTPHDLRRTYAKLARKAGAPMEVIQHSLGHASVTTTEKYMRTGEEANAGDFIVI